MQLTGNLEDLGLGEILQILSFTNKSGVLRLHATKKSGSIVFKSGKVVKAYANYARLGIGDLLVKSGALGADKVELAKRKQKECSYAEPLGSILSRDLGVSSDLASQTATRYVEKIIYSFFHWKEGCFVFELGDYSDTSETIKKDPLQFTLDKGLNPQFLAMEGLRLLDESMKDAPACTEAPGSAEKGGDVGGAESYAGDTGEPGPDASHYVDDVVKEIGEEGYIPGSEGGAAPRVAESKGLKILREMLEELSGPLELNEILLLILRFSSEIINRSVVFRVKGDSVVGYGQFGIELDDDTPDERVRGMRIPMDEPSIFREAIESGKIVAKELDASSWNDYLIDSLGGHRPVESFVAPIMVQNKVAMLLYGDNAPEPRRLDELSALEIFLGQTSNAIERIALEKKTDRKAG